MRISGQSQLARVTAWAAQTETRRGNCGGKGTVSAELSIRLGMSVGRGGPARGQARKPAQDSVHYELSSVPGGCRLQS